MIKYWEAASVVHQVYKVLSDVENLAGCTPAKVGDSSERTSIANSAEENRANFCKGLDGKPLFSALYLKRQIQNLPRCRNCTLVKGEKPHPVSYQGCSHRKGELQRVLKGSSGRMFSKFTSQQQSNTAALCQDTQHQKPKAPKTYGKACGPPCNRICHNRKFRK
jgi:hypothetical protein